MLVTFLDKRKYKARASPQSKANLLAFIQWESQTLIHQNIFLITNWLLLLCDMWLLVLNTVSLMEPRLFELRCQCIFDFNIISWNFVDIFRGRGVDQAAAGLGRNSALVGHQTRPTQGVEISANGSENVTIYQAKWVCLQYAMICCSRENMHWSQSL